jgi:hypothetical protein
MAARSTGLRVVTVTAVGRFGWNVSVIVPVALLQASRRRFRICGVRAPQRIALTARPVSSEIAASTGGAVRHRPSERRSMWPSAARSASTQIGCSPSSSSSGRSSRRPDERYDAHSRSRSVMPSAFACGALPRRPTAKHAWLHLRWDKRQGGGRRLREPRRPRPCRPGVLAVRFRTGEYRATELFLDDAAYPTN